jgi:hypothetical protein
MLQVIIGKSAFNGSPVVVCYHAAVENNSMEDLANEILKGLKHSVDIFVDTSLIDFLSTSPVSSLMDIKCLQAALSEQDIDLTVSEVSNDILLEYSKGIMVKVTSPAVNELGLPEASDFIFEDKINMVEIAENMRDKYGLYNPSIFVESPIDAIVEQLKSTESEGVPDSLMVNSLVEELGKVGLATKIYYLNED